MPVSDGVKIQSGKYVNQAHLREVSGKRIGATTDGVCSPSLPALVKRSSSHPYAANLHSVDMEQLEAEDKLGCARGVLWSVVFEATLAVGAVLYWKFHLFSH